MTARSRSGERPVQVPPQLVDALLASLRALAMAGQVETACRLAGQACAALREHSPADWKAFNAFLHRFARQTPDPGFGCAMQNDVLFAPAQKMKISPE